MLARIAEEATAQAGLTQNGEGVNVTVDPAVQDIAAAEEMLERSTLVDLHRGCYVCDTITEP